MAPTSTRPHVCVVVMGMFGCSPRMQYHTLSLLEHGYSVSVVAQPGSEPIEPLRNNQHLSIHYAAPPPAWAAQLPSVLGLVAKALWQLAVLLWLMLVALPRPVAILLQNPPAIPTMLVCWLAMLRHRATWVVDWHNLAYSMMQYKYGKHGWLISLSKGVEQTLGRQAQAGFCVTEAMQAFLQAEFGVQAAVLYDRPPDQFHPCSMTESHDLFGRLQQQLLKDGIGQSLQQQLKAAAEYSSGKQQTQQSTLLTVLPAGSKQPVSRPGRPALVVSSTSWTPDEDFGILLEAAQQYDAAAAAAAAGAVGGGKQGSSKKAGSSSSSSSGKSYPDVVFVITGRGPQREMYLARIRQLQLSRVSFCSMWLEPDDYPLMLGAADLGVSLHTSSSGIDLPMKVVDMFGAGLPVCAADFKCIGELVAEGETGLLFSSAEQLAQQLLQLLESFDGVSGSGMNGQLAQLRAGVAREQSGWRWRDNWDKVAAPVFAKIAHAAGGSRSRGAGGAGKRKGKKLA